MQRISGPQVSANVYQTTKILLILRFPPLLLPARAIQQPVVCRVLFPVRPDGDDHAWLWVALAAVFGALHAPRFENIPSPRPFFRPPPIKRHDFLPRLAVPDIPAPVDMFRRFFQLNEIHQQLKGSMQEDMILVVPTFTQGLDLEFDHSSTPAGVNSSVRPATPLTPPRPVSEF